MLGTYFTPVYHPLRSAKTVEDIENYPRWPNPDDPKIIEGKYKMAKKSYEETDYRFSMFSGGNALS